MLSYFDNVLDDLVATSVLLLYTSFLVMASIVYRGIPLNPSIIQHSMFRHALYGRTLDTSRSTTLTSMYSLRRGTGETGVLRRAGVAGKQASSACWTLATTDLTRNSYTLL